MTWVKTKLELEDMTRGQVLSVVLREGESLANVSRSAVLEGHTILAREPLVAPLWRLLIRRGD